MSVLKNFKNTPGRPMGGRQALNVIFFLQIRNVVPGWGRARARGACRPPPPRATGGPRPQARQGGLSPRPRGRQGGDSPPLGRPGHAPLYNHSTLISSSFEAKNSTKNLEKKKGVRRRKAAKPCRIPHL